MERSKGRLARLFERDGGRCYWCGDPVSIANHEPPLPNKAATVDHLRDRFNPTRWEPCNPGEGPDDRMVLACVSCNHIRSQKQQQFADPLIRTAVEIAGRKNFTATCIRLYVAGEADIFFAVRAWATGIIRSPSKKQKRRHRHVINRVSRQAQEYLACISSAD